MKKLFLVISLLTSAQYALTQYNSVAEMKAANPVNGKQVITSRYYSYRNGGGNIYTYDSSSTATDDSGSVIAPNNGVGRFIGQFPDGKLHIKQFGAKDSLNNGKPFYGYNNTVAISNAIKFANSDTKGRIKVFVDPGSYGADSINLFAGVILTGAGSVVEQVGHANSKLYQFYHNERDFIRMYDTFNISTRRYTYGEVSSLGLVGDSTGTKGHGISFRDPAGNAYSAQDRTVLRDLTITYFPSGGIELPNGATPITISDIKLAENGGDGGIYIKSVSSGTIQQSIGLYNISGDGNVNGLIRIDSLNKFDNVYIENFKSEARKFTNPFTHLYGEQRIPIIVKDCDSTVIDINSGNHISSIDSGAVFVKPGSIIKIIGSKTPRITWKGLGTPRVRISDLGADPQIIEGSGILAKNSQGFYPGFPIANQLIGLNSAGTGYEGKNRDSSLVPGVHTGDYNDGRYIKYTDTRFKNDYSLNIEQALGSAVLAETFDVNRVTASTTLVSANFRMIAIWLPRDATLSGIKWFQATQGMYTSKDENKLGLYTYSGGMLTLVDSTMNDGALWSATTNTWPSKVFSSAYSATAGLYFIGILYNSFSQTMPPAIGGAVGVANSAVFTLDFSNNAKISGLKSSVTTLPSSLAMSDLLIGTTANIYMALY